MSLTQLNNVAAKKKVAPGKEDLARARVEDMVRSGLTLGRIAVEAGVSRDGLGLWVGGGGDEAVGSAVVTWLAEIDEETRVSAAGFIETPTAKRIIRAFDQARQPKSASGQRGIALIYGASGAGKTETARYYADLRNRQAASFKTQVAYVRVDGECQTWVSMLNAVVGSIRGFGVDAYRERNLRQWIDDNIPAGGLIIFDEAQLLPVRRLDELRVFPDECGIAVAFMGNTAGYKALEGAKIAQITSRVGGARVVIEKPSEGDVDALLEAWNLSGRKVRELAMMIGLQDGGLRMLADAVTNARAYAKAHGVEVDERIFKSAAVSVNVWGVKS